MGRFLGLFSRIWGQPDSRRRDLNAKNELNLNVVTQFRDKARLKKNPDHFEFGFYANENPSATRIRLYRFLADSIPCLHAAIGLWTSLSASPVRIYFPDGRDAGQNTQAKEIIDDLFAGVYDNRYQKFAGVQALLVEYFQSLFTTGCIAGEAVLKPSGGGLDYFYFIDPASLRYEYRGGFWKIYQDQNGRKHSLDFDSNYYYGLKADSVNPAGKSLLASVPFVARIEQQLLTDMYRSMHNAGYHRIHVKVAPPERLPGESEKNYISRANDYFEQTAGMFRDFQPEDNPITWDDIKIEYIGPASKVSSSTSWYINHKAIIEDICAGTNLAPYMLGYSYGTTHNWALFKYELLQREVRAVQAAACGFLEWLCNLELALSGLDIACKIEFENEVIYGLNERMSAEKARVETIILKKQAGLLDNDQAREELAQGRISGV